MPPQWMSYVLVYGHEALKTLDSSRLWAVFDCIDRSLALLTDPMPLDTSPSDSPLIAGGRKYEFQCGSEEAEFAFAAHFYFNEDEAQIHTLR